MRWAAVLVMLLRWLAGGLSAPPGPSPYTRDILLRLPTYTIERERGIPIGQAMPERGDDLPAIIVPQRRLRPVARAHLLSHI